MDNPEEPISEAPEAIHPPCSAFDIASAMSVAVTDLIFVLVGSVMLLRTTLNFFTTPK
jgi:hypothetical protein